ncbi:hypothetical protein COBT_001042, partial [Conglomerata obtusa]
MVKNFSENEDTRECPLDNSGSKIFASEMSLQINKYLRKCKIKPRQDISSLITQIKLQRKIPIMVEKDILLFVYTSANELLDGQNISHKNLSWTEKLLRLILYYVYDFFYDRELTICLKENCDGIYIDMNELFLCLVQNNAHKEHSIALIKTIYSYLLKEKITLREIIDISENNILSNTDQFKKIFAELLNEIYKKVVLKICYNEHVEVKIQSGNKNFAKYIELKSILDTHPHYSVIWHDMSKPKCISKFNFERLYSVSSLSSIISDVNILCKDILAPNNFVVIVFDVVILDIIMMPFLKYTHFTNNTNLAFDSFCKIIERIIFLFLYDVTNTIQELAKSLCNLEKILIEHADSCI